jgi:hypothetical protein
VLKLRKSAPKFLHRPKPSLLKKRGQYRRDRYGEGTSIRPGSRSGAKAQDGSPGDLRGLTGVHVK